MNEYNTLRLNELLIINYSYLHNFDLKLEYYEYAFEWSLINLISIFVSTRTLIIPLSVFDTELHMAFEKEIKGEFKNYLKRLAAVSIFRSTKNV